MTLRPTALVLLACAGAAALVPVLGGAHAVGVGITLLMYVALTQSWIVLSGMTGYISLGHVVFYGLGAYVGAASWGALPLWLIVPSAGLAAVALALVLGLPAMRVRGPYFVILSFGLAELIKHVVVEIEGALGAFSRVIFGAPGPETLFYLMLALAAGASATTLLVQRARFGRALAAIRENEEAAETVGVPTVRFKLYAFALSAFVPGMVGSVMALRESYFQPQVAFDPVISFSIVTMAVVGGSSDARGPLLGAAAFVLISELLWARAPQLYLILIGALLIGFVLFVPDGIAGRIFRARR